MLEIKNIVKCYNNKTVLNKISLSFGDNGLCFIAGESGVGKSTLLNIISLLEDSDGEIIFNGHNLSQLSPNKKDKERGNIFGFVFQEFNLIENLSVEENLILCLNQSEKGKIDEILSKLKLINLKNQKVNTLSGGERQRLTLARALIRDVPIIVADEPTANIDEENIKIVMDLFKDISKHKLVIIACHNAQIIKNYADRIIVLEKGSVISDTIINIPIQHSKVYKKTSNKNSFSFKEKISFIINDLKKNKSRFFRLSFIMLFSIALFGVSISMFISDDINIIRQTISQNDQKFIETNLKDDTIKALNCYDLDFESSFFDTSISKIAFLNDDNYNLFKLVKGAYPNDDYEVLISDYLAESISVDKDIDMLSLITEKIDILGYKFEISGIFQTNYKDYFYKEYQLDNKNEIFREVRFNYYSVAFTNEKTYLKMNEGTTSTYITINENNSYINSRILRLKQDDNKEPICGEVISKSNQVYASISYAAYLASCNYNDIKDNPKLYFHHIKKIIKLNNGIELEIVGIYDDSQINDGLSAALISDNPILDFSDNITNLMHISSKKFNLSNMKTWIWLYENYLKIFHQLKQISLILAICLLIIAFILNLNYSNMKVEEYLHTIGVWRCIGITKRSIISLFLNDNLFFSIFIFLLFSIVITPLMIALKTIKIFEVSFCIYNYSIINYLLIVFVMLCTILISGIIPVLSLNRYSAVKVVRNQIKKK